TMSGKAAFSSTSREGIIAELKDTCKALDETIKASTEKKIRLENLIKALSEEAAESSESQEPALSTEAQSKKAAKKEAAKLEKLRRKQEVAAAAT
ncbi:envelope-like protein, partial [Trifolium medium]|nr:envelope-like protein [Trifolium medium]